MGDMLINECFVWMLVKGSNFSESDDSVSIHNANAMLVAALRLLQLSHFLYRPKKINRGIESSDTTKIPFSFFLVCSKANTVCPFTVI